MTKEEFMKAHNVREADCCAICVHGLLDYDNECACKLLDAPSWETFYWHNICDRFERGVKGVDDPRPTEKGTK